MLNYDIHDWKYYLKLIDLEESKETLHKNILKTLMTFINDYHIPQYDQI